MIKQFASRRQPTMGQIEMKFKYKCRGQKKNKQTKKKRWQPQRRRALYLRPFLLLHSNAIWFIYINFYTVDVLCLHILRKIQAPYLKLNRLMTANHVIAYTCDEGSRERERQSKCVCVYVLVCMWSSMRLAQSRIWNAYKFIMSVLTITNVDPNETNTPPPPPNNKRPFELCKCVCHACFSQAIRINYKRSCVLSRITS